ncbi:MAG: hypothetical protein M1831_007028 [Alyxoria varia]|nr:MAG: hypothetical protein M1831_007028 [Alyxoria varia]
MVAAEAEAKAVSFYDLKPKDKDGTIVPFSTYRNKVVLIVNTASKCGCTPQFQGLETLYKDLKAKHPNDFEILGFPCNQFWGQDPGTDDEIQSFCQTNYGVSFPVLGKINVNSFTDEDGKTKKESPVFEFLKNQRSGWFLRRVKWNFEKFLVGRDGKVKGRWDSWTKPEALRGAIEKELNSGAAAGKAEEKKKSEL